MPTATELQITLTPQQLKEFTACAKMCGLDLPTWLIQCAAVQAAAVIDALQTAQRRQRSSNESPRDRSPARVSTERTPESPVLAAARSYNERFRIRAKTP